jgi:hypothetical protein
MIPFKGTSKNFEVMYPENNPSPDKIAFDLFITST